MAYSLVHAIVSLGDTGGYWLRTDWLVARWGGSWSWGAGGDEDPRRGGGRRFGAATLIGNHMILRVHHGRLHPRDRVDNGDQKREASTTAGHQARRDVATGTVVRLASGRLHHLRHLATPVASGACQRTRTQLASSAALSAWATPTRLSAIASRVVPPARMRAISASETAL